MKSTEFLKACISSGVMVEAVSTEEQVKQAYKKGCKETEEKFAKGVKKRTVNWLGKTGFFLTYEELDETLKEYVK